MTKPSFYQSSLSDASPNSLQKWFCIFHSPAAAMVTFQPSDCSAASHDFQLSICPQRQIPKTGIGLGHSLEYNPPVASRYHRVTAMLLNLVSKDHHGLCFVWSPPPILSHPHPLWLVVFVPLSLLYQRSYCISFGYSPSVSHSDSGKPLSTSNCTTLHICTFEWIVI